MMMDTIRVLQIKCRCTGEKERFDSLSQGSISIGRDDKKIVLIHKSKMTSIGLILINLTFLCLETEQLLVLKKLVF